MKKLDVIATTAEVELTKLKDKQLETISKMDPITLLNYVVKYPWVFSQEVFKEYAEAVHIRTKELLSASKETTHSGGHDKGDAAGGSSGVRVSAEPGDSAG